MKLEISLCIYVYMTGKISYDINQLRYDIICRSAEFRKYYSTRDWAM